MPDVLELLDDDTYDRWRLLERKRRDWMIDRVNATWQQVTSAKGDVVAIVARALEQIVRYGFL